MIGEKDLHINELEHDNWYVDVYGMIFHFYNGELFVDTGHNFVVVDKNKYSDHVFQIFNKGIGG